MSGTGQQGGPLVTSFNVPSRSDLRLSESDGNGTMIKLAAQGTGCLSTCRNRLQRMIEVVPRGVILSDVISPQTVKPINTTLDLDSSGKLVLSGNIRAGAFNVFRCMSNTRWILSEPSATQPTTLTLTYAMSPPVTLGPTAQTGTSIFGTTYFSAFSATVSEPRSFNGSAVVADGIGRHAFKAQAGVFVLPSLTLITTSASTSVNVTVAVRSDLGRDKRHWDNPFAGVKVSALVPPAREHWHPGYKVGWFQ